MTLQKIQLAELPAWQRFGLIAAAVAFLFISVLLLRWTIAGRQQLDVGPPRDIAVNVEEASWRLAEAIRFETVSPENPLQFDGAAFLAFHDFLVDSYPRLHKVLAREVIDDFSLLYSWDGSEPALPGILLISHLDVVPLEVGSDFKWTHPAFSGVIDDGHVWGRGALDSKSAVIAMLEAVEALLAEGFTPRRTVYLAFGYDQEAGGEYGAVKIANLLRKRNVRIQFSIDEGLPVTRDFMEGLERPAAIIGLGEKGSLTLRLTARGVEGLAMAPPPHTALGSLSRAIHLLEESPLPPALVGPVAEMYDYLGPEMTLPDSVMFANRWLFSSAIVRRMTTTPATNAMLRTTIAPTVSRAGVKSNALPAEARALISIGLMPGDDMESLTEHVREVIDDPLIQVERVAGHNPAPLSRSNSKGFDIVHKTVRQIFPDAAVAPSLLIAQTDSRHYDAVASDSYRFLPVTLGRADLQRIHGSDERIAIEDLVTMIRFYAQLLRNAAG